MLISSLCWYLHYVDMFPMLISSLCWYLHYVDIFPMLIFSLCWYLHYVDIFPMLISSLCWYNILDELSGSPVLSGCVSVMTANAYAYCRMGNGWRFNKEVTGQPWLVWRCFLHVLLRVLSKSTQARVAGNLVSSSHVLHLSTANVPPASFPRHDNQPIVTANTVHFSCVIAPSW